MKFISNWIINLGISKSVLTGSGIIRKACNSLPEKRYHSATEMRNSLEKIYFIYGWCMIDENHWKGTASRLPGKNIYLEMKRKTINITITNNGRRSSKECRQFEYLTRAKDYLFDYIRRTTIQ